MAHVLRLLRRHGLTDVVVTVQFLAALVRNHSCRRGLGCHHLRQRGDAVGHGRQHQETRRLRLCDDTFLVISGDALTTSTDRPVAVPS